MKLFSDYFTEKKLFNNIFTLFCEERDQDKNVFPYSDTYYNLKKSHSTRYYHEK